MQPGWSVIITLKLWIEYTWKGDNKFQRLWQGNKFEIVSVYYVPNKICGGHSIQVKMAREVYEINDSQSANDMLLGAMSLIGGLWTFLLLCCSGLAICCDQAIYLCCKRVKEKDMEFAVAFGEAEDERYKMENAIEMTST